MGKFNKGNEQAYYFAHTTGVSGQTPWDQLQRMFYTQYLADPNTTSARVSLQDLQIRWMKKWILAHGLTPPVGNWESDLWKYMVSGLGIVPVKSTATNIFNFFANATN